MASRTIGEELPHQLASPTTAAERIASLDVLRGFALLGILLANIQDFASPTGILHDIPLDVVSQTGAHHALDVAVMTAQWIFVKGKMRAMFGLLFGAGTVLLLERIDRRAGPELAADIFHRRNMWLLFFGSVACQFLFKWGPWKLSGKLEYYQDPLCRGMRMHLQHHCEPDLATILFFRPF